MRSEVLPYLRCPVCGGPLVATPRTGAAPGSVRCPRGHSFDLARQGYLHLAGRTSHGGDTADMVAARAEFLAAGHYAFLSTALAGAAAATAAGGGATTTPATTPENAAEAPAAPKNTAGNWEDGPPLVVDAGAGTGWHLAAVLDALPEAVGLALDVSKPALRRAARAHPRAGAVLCDTWRRLPLADQAATVLLNVFAPRNGSEFQRVLRADGLLLVVVPAHDHLAELVAGLGLLRVDPEKPARVAASLDDRFLPAGQSEHRHTLRLPRTHVRALVGMGPSAWHTDPDTLARRIAALPETTEATAALHLYRYRPRTGLP